MWRKLDAFGIRWESYQNELIANSDYKKSDDTLRMVISGTAKQRQALCQYLEQLEGDKIINYGIQPSAAALITCIVFQHKQDHIHLVDGADGGYAMATLQLKAKLR